ncbi:hypothetical protein CALVIDRAFT_556671 [Calocera viscosa TUFC12733]|uniref:AB hydrolase-1 domain-containing protein n=1 Tax=Calocera viscosa (strain TUFC12733) TaxID=1330018 RepID=A0A167JT48_CALVF|nr:hypothetical protein CALVIDRAFT_556671 [Calocera viscosa TUFC12733]
MSFIWSTAELGTLVPGNEPIRLRYGDTHPGRPPSERYTTIVALHGAGFNDNIWLPWISHLPSDVRLIAINRRGFSGSSATHQSCEILPNDTEAFGRYTVDLFAFIKFVVETLKVPDHKTDGSGGIVLLGWNVILFEPAGFMVGIPFDRPLWDDSLPPEPLGRGFVDGLLQPLPAEKLPLVQASVDDMLVLAHDLHSWNGADLKEREGLARTAFTQIPPFIGLGILCCTTTLTACHQCCEWLTDICAGQANTTSRVIQGGNHFVMATNPKEFNDAVIGSLQDLGVQVGV